jgi:predicted ATPase
MQALAPVGSIAATDATRKLCEGYFTFKSLGPTLVKGVSEPIEVYEVTGLGPLRTRLQRAPTRGLTKFVGREREMEAVRHAAELTRTGHGQMVAVMAEPGVGKSRLFHEFKLITQSQWMTLEALSVSHGKASAYLPLLELLRYYFRIDATDDPRTRREKVTGRIIALDRSLEDTLPYLLGILSLSASDDPLAQMDAQLRRRRTHEALKQILLRESLNQPLMVILEDLHWIDGETQALLNLLVDSIGTARILLLVNYRPEYRHEWGSRTHYTQLRLDPLCHESAEAMLDALLVIPNALTSPSPPLAKPSKPLARSFAGEGQGEGSASGEDADLASLKRLIIERTEGNPFFMEEIVRVLLDEGAPVRNGTMTLIKPLTELKIPPTVQAILSARIDRLPAVEKELLQTLAVIGKDLVLELIKAVTHKSEEQLESMLSDLQMGEFIYEQAAVGDVEYTFKHALTHDVAYNSLLQKRRKALHERIGAALEALHRGRLDDHLDHLAHHFQRSDNAAKAVEYLRLAGEQAARRSSPREAIAYLREALERTKALPAEDERDRAELKVQFALGSALTAESWGAPEKMRAFERVSELAARTGAGAEVFPALWHLAEAYTTQEKLARGHELAQQSLRLAEASNNRRLLFGGHYVVAEVAFWSGNFQEARLQALAAMELYDRAADKDLALYYGMDPFAMSCWNLALVENSMGRCDHALNLCRDARAHATELSHVYSTAFSLMGIACLHQMHRQAGHAEAATRELSRMCREHGFSEMLGWAEWVLGWALFEQNREDPGLEKMAESIAFHESIGGTPGTPWRRGVFGRRVRKERPP